MRGDLEVSAGLVSRWKRMNNEERLRCCRCGRELLIGELVHVKYSGPQPPRYVRLYHLGCWEALFLRC